MTKEDEAFNEIERQAKQRKEAVLQALHNENQRLGLYKDAYGEENTLHWYALNYRTAATQHAHGMFEELEKFVGQQRNYTIEEVAQHIEKLKSFGQDTVSSLAIYIREMKK
jgi:hypothetical protein